MMKSMTGFGKASVEDEAYRVNIEIKSVNHRFLDVQLKLPTGMSAFDLAIRKQVDIFPGEIREPYEFKNFYRISFLFYPKKQLLFVCQFLFLF